MEMKAAVHAALEIWGMLFCAAAFAGLLFSGEIKKKQNKLLGCLLFVDAVQLLADTLAWLFRGNTTEIGFYVIRISNYMVYVTNYIILYLFTVYVLDYTHESEIEHREMAKYKRFMLGLCLIAVFILTLDQGTDVFYGFNEQNLYYRGEYWWMLQGIGILGMAVTGILLVEYRKVIRKDMYLCFLSYLLFPLAATVIQSWLYGFSLMNLAITLSLIAMYIISRTIQYKELLDNQAALSEMRIRIAVSQIGPHFLFNAMTTIKYLCLTDPKGAAKAVDELSMYFRGNLDAMTTNQTIPFEKEVDHVKHYLELEKVRFRERLGVEWELRERDFYLPALTLQPMVENAVKHGILKHPDGGTIIIRSDRTENGYLISVLDNGVGFDPSERPDDGRSHIGIANVRERLQEMCGGSLEIISEKGKGTECRILIPCGGTRR